MNYKIISDEKELEWFYDNILPKSTTRENFTFSLMSRKKYFLTEHPKGFPNSKMLEQRVVRRKSFESILNMIRRFEVAEGVYNFHGDPIPNNTLLLYATYDPSDSVKAYHNFKKNMDDILINLIGTEPDEQLLKSFSDPKGMVIRSHQKSKSSKHYIDFDIDVPKDFLPDVKNIVNIVKAFKGKAYIIDTKNGYHLLVSKDTEFDKTFNPMVIEESLRHSFPEDPTEYEVSQSKSGLIPLPGTYQGGYPVSILNKER